jgi:hypothetical protein
MTTHLPQQSIPQQARRYASTGVVTIRLLLLWLLAFSASGTTTESIEDGVKAAFLYKFADYVDWPETRFADANTPITIALMDADSIAGELNRIAVGRTAQGRTLAIKRLRPGESIDGVHILFIGGTTAPQSGQVLQAVMTHSVLVVTDADGALARGSMINFVLIERHLKFEVALDNVEKSGLKLSSRLLAVAQHVHREAR